MAMLDAAARKHVAASRFGLPSEHKYPMPDAEHAADAKGRAKAALSAGHITQSQYDHIVAMANRILGPGHHS